MDGNFQKEKKNESTSKESEVELAIQTWRSKQTKHEVINSEKQQIPWEKKSNYTFPQAQQ